LSPQKSQVKGETTLWAATVQC